MPTYDYKCEACGADFEVERAFGAGGKVKCAHCSSVRTLKVFSAAGIVFRGGGFYVTDSKSGASKGGTEQGSSDQPPTDGPAASNDSKQSKSEASTDGASKNGAGMKGTAKSQPGASSPKTPE